MKRIFLAVIVFISFATLVQATEYEVTPMLSKQISAADSGLDDSKIFYGLRAGVKVNEIISLRAGYEQSDSLKMGDGGKSDAKRATADLLFGLASQLKALPGVTPYALMGAGYEKIYRTYANEKSQLFFNVGAGLKYALSKKLSLVAEGRIIQKSKNQDTDAVLGAGLSFKFGDSSKNAVNTIFTKNNTPKPIIRDNAVQVQEVAIPVRELAKLTPQKPTEVDEVIVESTLKVQEVVVEPTIQVQEIVQEVPKENISSLEPVEFVGESSYVMSESVVEDFVDVGLYVQVEASLGAPSSKLLDKLDNAGYPYVLHSSTRRGKDATLVLVGPFTSKADAENDLKQLKKIKRDAFIKTIK